MIRDPSDVFLIPYPAEEGVIEQLWWRSGIKPGSVHHCWDNLQKFEAGGNKVEKGHQGELGHNCDPLGIINLSLRLTGEELKMEMKKLS